ncbi:unnamed protein product [Natator depressus]
MTGDRSHPPITMRPRRFFILLQDFSGEGGGQVPRGSLVSQAGEPPALDCPFWAKLLDTEAMVQVPARAARELSKEQAGMLQAVTNGDERLGALQTGGAAAHAGGPAPRGPGPGPDHLGLRGEGPGCPALPGTHGRQQGAGWSHLWGGAGGISGWEGFHRRLLQRPEVLLMPGELWGFCACEPD